MKKRNVKNLVSLNLILLVPFLIYGLYKNGYLIYMKGLISGYMLFKPLYLTLISFVIKGVVDLFIYKKVKIDYNLVYLTLVSLIMPYNINLLIYGITLFITYILTLFLSKHFKFNRVCFMYLILILVSFLFNDLSFLNPMEAKYTFSFSAIDILMGRSVGGISSTSIILSLLVFSYYTFNFYYKKDIPLFINLTYLLLTFIYFLFTKDNNFMINSEVIFGSVFVATLPMFSPGKRIFQILYGILIGLLTFALLFITGKIISIYLAIFITSLLENVKIRQKRPKFDKITPLSK